MRLVLALALLLPACADKIVEVDHAVHDDAAADAVEDSAADTSSGSETSVDDGASDVADAAPTLETLCKGGAPRLEWDGSKCLDHSFATDAGAPTVCTFLLAEDGPLRCLPEPHGKVVGARSEDCAKGGPRLIDAIVKPVDEPQLVAASVEQATGRFAVYRASLVLVDKWRIVKDDVCDVSDAGEAYPYRNAEAGSVLVTSPTLPISSFYAAP